MLDLMRKHAYSWLTRAVVIALIGVFAFWGVSTGMFTRIKPVATVNGHQILTKDVDQQAQQLRRRLEQIYGPDAAGRWRVTTSASRRSISLSISNLCSTKPIVWDSG